MAVVQFGGARPMNPAEHPTSNIQRRTSNGSATPRSLRRSVFAVGCSRFSLGSGVQSAKIFVEFSMNQAPPPPPPPPPGGGGGDSGRGRGGGGGAFFAGTCPRRQATRRR